MFTEFIRDQLFTTAWFGMMTMVWFGWAQENPPKSWAWKLGVGSVIGVAIAGTFTVGLVKYWETASALEGNYQWFGLIVGIEVIVAAAGCFYLLRKDQSRWMAWWVAVVVAAHFASLAFLFGDISFVLLAVIELLALAAIFPAIKRSDVISSRLAGPTMGASLLFFAIVSAIIYVSKHGAPWS